MTDRDLLRSIQRQLSGFSPMQAMMQDPKFAGLDSNAIMERLQNMSVSEFQAFNPVMRATMRDVMNYYKRADHNFKPPAWF